MRTAKHQRAFTLVELSIVLVIIGLLVGGVLTGQSLIRAAELRSVTSQYQRYIAATMTFRDKYFALPGDMTNATAYWGIAGGTGADATCATTTGTGTATCNGNGDGNVARPSAAYPNEAYRYWQHLANAGLIEGNYTGVGSATNTNVSDTTNSPSGRISSSLWYVTNRGASSVTYTFDGPAGNQLRFGSLLAANPPNTNLLAPADMYNIDMKLDDGKPATGKVIVMVNSDLATCTNTSDQTNMAATYLLTSSTPGCIITWPTVF